MDVSIVIVNWNTREDLRLALQSCFAHSGPLAIEVIVVDNASTDGSVEMVREQFPQVAIICNSDNLGYTVACNQGMRQASGRYYLMLNSDAQLTPGCLPEMVRLMNTHPDIGTASAQLLNPDGSEQNTACHFPSVITHLLPARLTALFQRAAADATEAPDGAYDVDWVFGACQMARAETVAQVGMMEERIFMWYDDADWCRRMQQAGWRRVIATRATCVHKVHRSADALPPLRRNLQKSMSEFAYFRLHHGRAATALLWTVRTLYSLAKVLLLGSAWLLTLGRVDRLRTMLRFNWGRARFHLLHAADILWREPRPYRAADVPD